MSSLTKREAWRRASAAALLTMASAASGVALAEPVRKTYVATGTSLSCDPMQPQCRHTFGIRVDYLDPSPSSDDQLGIGSLVGLQFDIGIGGRGTLLELPYLVPRASVAPSLSIDELGDDITLELLAFSQFDPAPGGVDDGIRWRIAADGSFDWNSGHGEEVFGPVGAIDWRRLPEPTTAPLAAVALLALALGRRRT
jgi:hypothetical protein